MNKKAQTEVGKTISSFVVMLIVFLIMAVFVLISSGLAIIKKPAQINLVDSAALSPESIMFKEANYDGKSISFMDGFFILPLKTDVDNSQKERIPPSGLNKFYFDFRDQLKAEVNSNKQNFNGDYCLFLMRESDDEKLIEQLILVKKVQGKESELIEGSQASANMNNFRTSLFRLHLSDINKQSKIVLYYEGACLQGMGI